MTKRKKILAIRQDDFLSKLQQYKAGKLSEKEFCNLLVEEVNYLKMSVLKRYEIELEKDKEEIKILSTIKHKILNNIKLEPSEKKIVLSIIG